MPAFPATAHTPVVFDTIILLTGPVEESVLAGVLRNHNPRLTIHAAKSLAELDAIDASILGRARLIDNVEVNI